MSISKDMVGFVCNELTVLSREPNNSYGQAMWLCECSCGNLCCKRGNDLRKSKAISCGCIAKKKLVARNTKHGHAVRNNYSGTYESWRGMVNRCTNESNAYYYNYGGAGISVCKEWLEDFRNFLSDMGERPEGLTIERVDTLGDYCKSNCKWASMREQALNRKYQWNHNK